MKPIVLSTVATTNCYKEFLLTKYSLEQYHDCVWYVSCDEFTQSKISHFDNVCAEAGMFLLRNVEMVDRWRALSENHKQLNMYYEQKPLEYVQRNYITANFPINYNIGWWRFNETYTRDRLNKVHLRDDQIYFGEKPAVNFHLHLLKDSQMNHGKFLMDKLFQMMSESNNKKYHEFLKCYEEVRYE